MTEPLLTGKRHRRELLAAHGVPAPRYAVVDSPHEVRGVLARSGYPAVLKPAGLRSGLGVYLVTAPAQLTGWAAMLIQLRYDGPVIVEEYVPGRELSAEFTSTGGTHRLTALLEHELSLPPLFVEMGHLYPGPAAGAPGDQVARVAASALTACGHRDGPAHVNVRITPGGPRVTGLGPRDPRDPAARLSALARPGECAANAYFWLPAGEVESVSGLAGIRALDYVREVAFPFSPGDRLSPTVDSHTRHGHVTVTAPSARSAAERIAEVKRMLRVTVRPRPAPSVPRPRSGRRVVVAG